MTEHADRIWAAARVLNEVAETEDQSGAINDLLAVANALRSTPAAPRPCPACGRSIDHSWWPVGDDSYGCDAAPQPDPVADVLLVREQDFPGEDGPAQPGAAATPGVHAVLAPFLVSPDHILDGLTCWCRPYRDAEDPEVIIHQREARA